MKFNRGSLTTRLGLTQEVDQEKEAKDIKFIRYDCIRNFLHISVLLSQREEQYLQNYRICTNIPHHTAVYSEQKEFSVHSFYI